MRPSVKNLFANLPASSAPEEFLTLVQTEGVRVERIVSNGQCSPKDFWYDQEEEEWVLLLRGTARIEFENGHAVRFAIGDSLLIPRRARHRVSEVSDDAIWLAVHYR